MNRKLCDAIIDLLEMFPTLEKELMDIFCSYALKETTGREFEHDARLLCLGYVKNCIQTIKQETKKDKSLFRAYFDVARYQTDIKDAAIDWQSDETILNFMLKRRPPPATPGERRSLPVPLEVTKKREL